MERISFRSIRSLYAAARGGGDMSPSLAWYAMMASFIALSLVGAAAAYHRYQWAIGVAEITVPEDMSVTVSRADIEDAVTIYERKKTEYQRLVGNGQLQAPVVSLGERATGETPGVQPATPVIPVVEEEGTPTPEFF